MSRKRVFLIVLDSFGIGYEPDAAEFGDEGSNTLATIRKSPLFTAKHMEKLGLFSVDGVEKSGFDGTIEGAFGRMREQSKAKDTTAGHWEIAGLISKKPFPVYPDGFPVEIMDAFEKQTGRGILCNKPYSGTDVIRDFGQEHVETGKWIVYTSADSVFQIAAHEKVVPLEELYEACRVARRILVGKHGVGRVIARPFDGSAPDFKRTANRHDFSLVPPRPTMLNLLQENGFDTISIGKISDIFAGSGIDQGQPTKSNEDGMRRTMEMVKTDFNGICFTNLVDFDMSYGHRNDIDGYAKAAALFDEWLGRFMALMQKEDILMITGDHGCDPGYPGTDHTREYTPILIYGEQIRPGVNLGTRKSFADIGATILDLFGIKEKTDGESFKEQILKL